MSLPHPTEPLSQRPGAHAVPSSAWMPTEEEWIKRLVEEFDAEELPPERAATADEDHVSERAARASGEEVG